MYLSVLDQWQIRLTLLGGTQDLFWEGRPDRTDFHFMGWWRNLAKKVSFPAIDLDLKEGRPKILTEKHPSVPKLRTVATPTFRLKICLWPCFFFALVFPDQADSQLGKSQLWRVRRHGWEKAKTTTQRNPLSKGNGYGIIVTWYVCRRQHPTQGPDSVQLRISGIV